MVVPPGIFNQPKASVYGKREGVLPGLVVLSNHPKNIYRQTRGYKTGTVMGITMLPRAEMVKPDSDPCWQLRHHELFES